MSNIQIEVELFKGEEPIDFPIDVDGDNFEESLKGARLSLDRGDANRVIVYIATDGELIEIMDKTDSTFDIDGIKERIEEIKGNYYG
jgi:hypothetical protein